MRCRARTLALVLRVGTRRWIMMPTGKFIIKPGSPRCRALARLKLPSILPIPMSFRGSTFRSMRSFRAVERFRSLSSKTSGNRLGDLTRQKPLLLSWVTVLTRLLSQLPLTLRAAASMFCRERLRILPVTALGPALFMPVKLLDSSSIWPRRLVRRQRLIRAVFLI